MEDMQLYKFVAKDGTQIDFHVRPDPRHEWTVSTKELAEIYGVSEVTIRRHKGNHEDEFEEGYHYFFEMQPGVQNLTSGPEVVDSKDKKFTRGLNLLWTKAGAWQMGHFIKSERAKEARRWMVKAIMYVEEQAQKTEMDILLENAKRDVVIIERMVAVEREQRRAVAERKMLGSRIDAVEENVSNVVGKVDKIEFRRQEALNSPEIPIPIIENTPLSTRSNINLQVDKIVDCYHIPEEKVYQKLWLNYSKKYRKEKFKNIPQLRRLYDERQDNLRKKGEPRSRKMRSHIDYAETNPEGKLPSNVMERLLAVLHELYPITKKIEA